MAKGVAMRDFQESAFLEKNNFISPDSLAELLDVLLQLVGIGHHEIDDV